ncbi:MAG: peptide deformylase [Roseibacillus sp.]|jgi:peptide deformylase
MILPIIQFGDPILRKRCRRVKEVTDEVNALVEDMLETMHDAQGVGLAAPQVGFELRLVVVDVSHDPECVTVLRVNGEDAKLEDIMPLIFINPDFEACGEKERMEEGCLSIQDIRAEVKRSTVVKGTFGFLDGSEIELEADGLLARVIQHETDHLNGVLFVDRVSTATKLTLRRKLKSLKSSAL